jgi:hypothetical protein
MTQEASDDIILPDAFQNTHKIHINESGIFSMGVLKKIGKIKTCFFPNQNFHNQKKLRGIESITIGVLTPKNAEFPSLNEFGHHEIDLYLKVPRHPIFQY